MFIVSLLLLAMWLLALGVFHVAGTLVHLLLVLALVSFGWHLWDKSRLRSFANGNRPRR